MAEPEKQAGDPGPQPEFDAQALLDQVSERVRGELVNWKPPEAEVRQIQVPQPQPNPRSPIEDLISPIVNPALNRVGIAAASAEDAAIFYATHPEAIEYKDDLEKIHKAMIAQNTPFDRETEWSFFRGRKGNFEKFVEIENAKKEEAARKAAEAADTGAGAHRERRATVKDPHLMSDEELDKSMEGVAF